MPGLRLRRRLRPLVLALRTGQEIGVLENLQVDEACLDARDPHGDRSGDDGKTAAQDGPPGMAAGAASRG